MLPIGAKVLTPDGFPAIVVAHNPVDRSRVVVRRWWNGIGWLCDKGYAVERLTVVNGVEAGKEAA